MKRNSKSRNKNRDLYERLDFMNTYSNMPYDDYRYWGLFYGKNGKLMVDTKRFQKMTGYKFSEERLKVINNRNTHYFYPKKSTREDYNCNIFKRAMTEIEADWLGDAIYTLDRELNILENDFDKGISIKEYNDAIKDIESGKGGYRSFIAVAMESIEKKPTLTVGNDYNFQCGILDYEEASMNINMQNWFNEANYKARCFELKSSMYAQFFHQMVSKIEAVQIEVMDRNHVDVEHYSRETLYGAGAKSGVNIKELEHHKYFELAYCIWNFLKHNSLSTYKKLKEKFPEVLIDHEFYGGDLAYIFIKFDDKLICDVYNGCAQFFKEFCKTVWDEDEDEAQWNYNDFFEHIVDEQIETITNPLGLPPWI